MISFWKGSYDYKRALEYDFTPIESTQVPGSFFRCKCNQCGKVYNINQRMRIWQHNWKHKNEDAERAGTSNVPLGIMGF